MGSYIKGKKMKFARSNDEIPKMVGIQKVKDNTMGSRKSILNGGQNIGLECWVFREFSNHPAYFLEVPIKIPFLSCQKGTFYTHPA